MKEPKAGSRKADVFKAMKSGGYSAGLAKGIELGLQETTVRSWAPAWGVQAPRKEGAPKGERKVPSAPRTAPAIVGPRTFSPFYKYPSEGAATRAVGALCKRAGCEPGAYHIIEQGGLFAIAPVHYQPKGPAPAFKVGDYVTDVITPGVVSRVIVTGQLTCTIASADDAERVVSSYYLRKATKPAPKPKGKAKATKPSNKRTAKALNDSKVFAPLIVKAATKSKAPVSKKAKAK